MYNVIKSNTVKNDDYSFLNNINNQNGIFLMLEMKTKNCLLLILNKLDLDSYLEGNDDEKINFVRRILIDDFEDFNSVKIKNILNLIDGFVSFFNKINSGPFGY